jgi:hypothetical protein
VTATTSPQAMGESNAVRQRQRWLGKDVPVAVSSRRAVILQLCLPVIVVSAVRSRPRGGGGGVSLDACCQQQAWGMRGC